MARRILGRREFVPPIEAVDGGWQFNLDAEERALLTRLMGELRDLLTSTGDNPLLGRLFPTAYPDDEEKEEEYQRLYPRRTRRQPTRLDQPGHLDARTGRAEPVRRGADDLFLQSTNAIRLVLGSLLGITDDDSDVARMQTPPPSTSSTTF